MNLTEADRLFIETQRIGHFATVDQEGCPHVVPICFAQYGNFIYFVVDEKPKRRRFGLQRLRNISTNPRIALVVDRYDEDWRQLAYVQIRGTGYVVQEALEYSEVVDELKRRYVQYQAMTLAMSRNPMVRIEPLHVHRWSASAA